MSGLGFLRWKPARPSSLDWSLERTRLGRLIITIRPLSFFLVSGYGILNWFRRDFNLEVLENRDTPVHSGVELVSIRRSKQSQCEGATTLKTTAASASASAASYQVVRTYCLVRITILILCVCQRYRVQVLFTSWSRLDWVGIRSG